MLPAAASTAAVADVRLVLAAGESLALAVAALLAAQTPTVAEPGLLAPPAAAFAALQLAMLLLLVACAAVIAQWPAQQLWWQLVGCLTLLVVLLAGPVQLVASPCVAVMQGCTVGALHQSVPKARNHRSMA